MNIKSKHVERSKSFTISTSHHHASPQDELVRSTSSDGSDFSESIYAPISEETRQEGEYIITKIQLIPGLFICLAKDAFPPNNGQALVSQK